MTRKNSNGLGSIRKKKVKGRTYYEGRYTDPITHVQKSVSATSEDECSRKLRDVLAKITTGAYVTPKKMTVAQWMEKWLEKKRNLEPASRAKYESVIRLYILPKLGKAQLQELRRVHCQDFIDSLDRSPKTVHGICGVLTAALQDAVKMEIIAKNPASDLDLPRIIQRSPVAMESDLQFAFEKAVNESPYKNVYLLALHTGMRISEVLGLQWKNIDMKSGELKITGQLERKRGKTERELKDTTKNHKDRVIVIPPYVVDYLKDEKRRQNENRLHAGKEWQNGDDLIFTRTDGSPMPHRTIEHAFNRIKNRLGHPEITLHTLRKTYITNLVHEGEDIKTISASVGHSASDITLAVYTAERKEDMRRSAERRQKRHEKP